MVDEDEKQKAREDAYRLISYRDRSESELKRRLLDKGHDLKVVEAIIPRIKELGYLDDRRFAEKWVRHKVKHSPKGSYFLYKELEEKGVAKKIINEVLKEEYPYGLEYENALKLSKKWRNKSRNKDKELVKLKVYLKNKGFNYEIISNVVDDIVE